MAIEFHPSKSAADVAAGRPGFEAVEEFDWTAAFVVRDDRFDYGEDRFIALGPINGVLHSVVFTPRGTNIRVISLRIASRKERRRYAGF